MSLFKKKLTLDEIIAALEEMTPEDKAALKAMLTDTEETTEEEAPTEETTEEGTETEETEEAPVEEAPTEAIEESTNDGEETPTPDDVEAQTEAPVEAEEEAPVEEAVTEEVAEETPEENTDKGDISELYAMLNDLKKTVEALAARINADAENEGEEEESEEFGITPNNFGGETHKESDLEKVKAKYWSF